MWIEENLNPLTRRVGDCSVRAVAKALDISWEEAYTKIALNGFLMGDMPSSDAVWGSVLRQAGFHRDVLNEYQTVDDFVSENPNGLYVLATGGHVVTACNGNHYDTWDSSAEPVIYYWTKGD